MHQNFKALPDPCIVVAGELETVFAAMRLALQKMVSGMELQNRLRILRGWKLFILIPRLLLFRPARGGKVPKNQLLDRLSKFANGQWLDLLGKSQEASENAARLRSRRRRNRVDEVEKRVERAEALISMEEISAARQADPGGRVEISARKTVRAGQRRVSVQSQDGTSWSSRGGRRA